MPMRRRPRIDALRAEHCRDGPDAPRRYRQRTRYVPQGIPTIVFRCKSSEFLDKDRNAIAAIRQTIPRPILKWQWSCLLVNSL